MSKNIAPGLLTYLQPENIGSEKQISEFKESIGYWCGFCQKTLSDRAKCDTCMVPRLIDFVRPKALVLYHDVKIWLADNTIIRFTYPNGIEYEYSINVLDITHVEMTRSDMDETSGKIYQTKEVAEVFQKNEKYLSFLIGGKLVPFTTLLTPADAGSAPEE